MKKIIPYILAAWLLGCCNVFAIDLQTAKSKGLVGETTNGYIAVVKNNGEAKALANTINNQRKEKYKQIAKRNKISLQAVEQLAGKTGIEKTPKGQFIQVGGTWKKK